MSLEPSQGPLKIAGDWSIAGISLQHQRLEDDVSLWIAPGNASMDGREPLICLESVEDIDLSGWQVLACAFRILRAQGLSPALINVREDVRRNLERLGFSRELPISGGQACP